MIISTLFDGNYTFSESSID